MEPMSRAAHLRTSPSISRLDCIETTILDAPRQKGAIQIPPDTRSVRKLVRRAFRSPGFSVLLDQPSRAKKLGGLPSRFRSWLCAIELANIENDKRRLRRAQKTRRQAGNRIKHDGSPVGFCAAG
jgi:hypothetical protein